MSTVAAEAKGTGAATPLLPPEEQFWQRYSPHHEAPLSLTGSIALHGLVLGGLFLAGIYLASILFKPERKIPVEPVRLIGGGGDRKGSAAGKAGGGRTKGDQDGKDAEPEGGADEPPLPGEEKIERLPELSQVEKNNVAVNFDPADVRYIEKSSTNAAKVFARMDGTLRSKLRLADGPAAKGRGGDGEGGGKGSGKGKGVGDGDGGKATLTQREKRMLRWHMAFTANTGPEYVAQLRGLGAILAFPMADGEYKLIEDLRAPAKWSDNDIGKIQRIYWIDDKARSVTDVLNALQVRLSHTPSQFVAFMPEKLEDELFAMERRYVEKVLKKRFHEDSIEETRFRVVPTAKGYKPELVNVTMK